MSETAQAPRRSLLMRVMVYFLKALTPLIVLAATAGLFMWMMETAPQAERKTRERVARLVEVIEAEHGPQQVRLRAQGTVRAAREVSLRAQVTGEVVWVSERLVPGATVAAGAPLLRIDPRDFELAVASARSDLAEAEAELAMEEGNQRVARREYEILERDLANEERALVLREPQLAMARARVDRARAALDTALLDLERSALEAPFDALVVSEDIDPGTRVATTSQELARLIGTDAFWMELALRQSDLRWLDMAESGGPGARVILRQPGIWPAGAQREGRVLRLLTDLTGTGRMARVLVEVTDPLALSDTAGGAPRLLVGQYLEATIEGRTLEGAVALDRRYLRPDDTVWLMTDDDKLAITPVEVAYRGAERVIVTGGLPQGARIVTTNMTTAADGMPLRLGMPETGEPEAPQPEPGPPAAQAAPQTGAAQAATPAGAPHP